MLCSRIFDFVTGTEIVVVPPGVHAPTWDIVRPNEAAEELLAAHARALQLQTNSRPPDRADRLSR